jgi:predicted metallopeptidase
MRYVYAQDIQERMMEIIRLLKMNHVDLNRIKCFRGIGSKARGVIARCHALGKLMQKAMSVEAFYAIEFLARFDKLSKEEQDKVIIHELMHVPKSFGGGFRHHDYVEEKNVDILYEMYLRIKGSLNKF